MASRWIWVQIPKEAGSALSIIQSHNPSCPLTLIASKAPNSSLPFLICASLFLHLCVWTWWPGGGFGVKGLQWSWECGKPPLVWSNHSSLSIILPPSLPPSDLSQPITSQSCLSPPFYYSHLTGQKIRVTLGGLLSSPTSPSLHRPSFYFSPITPSSLVGIWRVTLGQFNLSSPSADQSSKSVTASLLWAYPLQQVVSLFSTLHTSPALLCYTELSISSSVTPVFHSLVFIYLFFLYLWLSKSPVSLRCFRMALLCCSSDGLCCAAVPVEKCEKVERMLQKVSHERVAFSDIQ